jgi:hypothetical protein
MRLLRQIADHDARLTFEGDPEHLDAEQRQPKPLPIGQADLGRR